MPEHPEEDWNCRLFTIPWEGENSCAPELGNSTQGRENPRKDSRVACSHDLVAAEQGMRASPQLAASKIQSRVTLAGPWDSPRRTGMGVNRRSLGSLVHTEVETL